MYVMERENASLKVEFRNNREKVLVPLASLVENAIDFLENYGEESIVGHKFFRRIGSGDGESKFRNLLKACEYEDDPIGFFREIIETLEKGSIGSDHPLVIHKVPLPYLFTLRILEVILPGNKLFAVKSIRQLQELTNVKIPDQEKEDLKRILKLYPVRLSLHTIRQMRISDAIRYQYMPFQDELNDEGFIHTWVGQFHRGIVEQMYANRIIFILNMKCPVYCRFCFRKHKECRNQRAPTQTHVKDAATYVKNSPGIKEIVLTGGDPFMNRATLTMAVDLLKEIPHVQTLRIATRSISYYPHLFYANNDFWLNYLKRKSLEIESKGKRIEIATHFIHPDEVSIDSLDVITELTKSGIPVYVQTPLLGRCNDSGPELVQLYRSLRGAGAEMHYIYIPCSPIKGNRRYVTPISTGIEVAAFLRANLSDRAIPRICTATKIGKIDWNSSGWAVKRDEHDDRYIWIRTPYTEDYIREFTPILQLHGFARINPEGTLDVKFMADIGDEDLLWGQREPISLDSVPHPDRELGRGTEKVDELLPRLERKALEDQCLRQSVVPTGSATLFRTHRTRVEFDLDADERERKQNVAYIRKHKEITDVVLSSRNDAVESLHRLISIMKMLEGVHHVTAYRLRSLKFNYAPQSYSRTVINRLANLNQLLIVNPKRLEIETQFLHSSEITQDHGSLANLLRRKGITVYTNTPILPFINDSEEEVAEIAYRCRENGIEFHHLYLAGLPIQKPFEGRHPLDISTVLDIATRLRRHESGRGIPRLIVRTPLGEVDFGLTSKIMGTGSKGRILLSLTPYSMKYFKDMDPEFTWPKGVKLDQDERPVIRIPGLKRTPEFLLS
jgi:L-lysine 2,3-aminomutase